MNREREGELFIVASAVLWGLFPVITVLSISSLSPLLALILSNVIAAIFFVVILSVRGKWRELGNQQALPSIIAATFCNGIAYYVLVFWGLRFTSAGNASILTLTEIFFSFLFFHIWRKEYISRVTIWGIACMVVGALIVLYPNRAALNIGDVFILIASAIAPVGNYFQQKARKFVSSETTIFIRSALTAAVLLCWMVIKGDGIPWALVRVSLPIVLINGIVLFGIEKMLWIESIHRISVTKANAFHSLSPLVTLLFAAIVLHAQPTLWQLLAIIPMVFGVVLLGSSSKDSTVPRISLTI